jgi:hypothetical protein
MASEAQQYQTQFTMQSRPLPHTLPPQPFSNYYGQNYPNQPPRQDPWNGQGPLRNPNQARPGIAVFDPVTDPISPPIDCSAFVNTVDYWTMNNTDPAYLLSPNDPMAPPQDLFTTSQQHLFQQQHPQQQTMLRAHYQGQIHNSSPIEMRLTAASPPPDSQNFVNYNSSSPLFTNNYTTESVSSSLTNSIEQVPNSPLVSASSPGGSEGMFSSYQHSDPGMAYDQCAAETFDNQFLPPPSPVRPSPNRSVHGVTFDFSPEPEHHTTRRAGPSRATGRPGGRALGTHLPAKVAKAAHDMRKTVACWHCVLQRDKVRCQVIQSRNLALMLSSADPVTFANDA